jgi:serine/threonine protein phosphatase 1
MADEHIFAIGDVHGRADLLRPLLNYIDEIATRNNDEYRIIFLGDIIDRGPQSREAMDLVVETLKRRPSSILIRGNHDWFPVRILDELAGDQQRAALHHWISRLGGDATLRSYGHEPFSVAPRELLSVFPSEHLKALREATAFVDVGDYLFVHAGIIPGVPLTDQRAYDMMWVREEFLSCVDHGLDKIVVHGHTVTTSGLPELMKNRIALDTGAYDSGLLTAFQISLDGRQAFLGSSRSGVQIIQPHAEVNTIPQGDNTIHPLSAALKMLARGRS